MILLFVIPAVIWGSTWWAITFQLGHVPPVISVFYRFALAALITFAWAKFKGFSLKFSWAQHRWFILQGLFLFCLNYLFTYYSEMHLASGLAAVAQTALLYGNMLGVRLYFKTKLERSTIIGSIIGGIGILLIFHKELSHFEGSREILWGLFLNLIATLMSSNGNMVTTKLIRDKVQLQASTGWAMLYGTALTGVFALVSGHTFSWDSRPSYLWSLLYLTVIGSVVAFNLYMKLIEKLGAAKAAYTAIISPILALVLSSLFEGLRWDTLMIVGVALSIWGNVFVLRKPQGDSRWPNTFMGILKKSKIGSSSSHGS